VCTFSVNVDCAAPVAISISASVMLTPSRTVLISHLVTRFQFIRSATGESVKRITAGRMSRSKFTQDEQRLDCGCAEIRSARSGASGSVPFHSLRIGRYGGVMNRSSIGFSLAAGSGGGQGERTIPAASG
jgi:hypothetical protein